MLNEIIRILGISSMSVLFVVAEPSILIKRWIFHKIYGERSYDSTFFWKLITCCLSSGFYIGLLFTRDIYLASIISITGELICRKINEFRL